MKNREYYKGKKFLVIKGPDAFEVFPGEGGSGSGSGFGSEDGEGNGNVGDVYRRASRSTINSQTNLVGNDAANANVIDNEQADPPPHSEC